MELQREIGKLLQKKQKLTVVPEMMDEEGWIDFLTMVLLGRLGWGGGVKKVPRISPLKSGF